MYFQLNPVEIISAKNLNMTGILLKIHAVNMQIYIINVFDNIHLHVHFCATKYNVS